MHRGVLLIPNGPDRPGTIAGLHAVQELPGVLVRLMTDTPRCHQAGEYVLMEDPARMHLTPKTGRATAQSHAGKVALMIANPPHQGHG